MRRQLMHFGRSGDKSGNRRIMSLSTEQLLRDCEAISEEGSPMRPWHCSGERIAGKYLPQAEIIMNIVHRMRQGRQISRKNSG